MKHANKSKCILDLTLDSTSTLANQPLLQLLTTF